MCLFMCVCVCVHVLKDGFICAACLYVCAYCMGNAVSLQVYVW